MTPRNIRNILAYIEDGHTLSVVQRDESWLSDYYQIFMTSGVDASEIQKKIKALDHDKNS